MTAQRRAGAAVVALTMLTACSPADPTDPADVPPGTSTGGHDTGTETDPRPVEPSRADASPLAGTVVVVDAGHQLGNTNFPAQVNAAVQAGGFTKPCNTTGTQTDDGFAEATFNFRVADRLRERLTGLGSRVIMTRTSNRYDRWGPCVDERGTRGNRIEADLRISIHGDGSFTDGQGFHVITPTDRAPWTDDIYAGSRRLALEVASGLLTTGFDASDYVAGGTGIEYRADLATLNLSDIPAVVVECGNMRNRQEAAVMSTTKGQARYAAGMLRGIRAFLDR